MTAALRSLGYKVSHWAGHESILEESLRGEFRWSLMDEYDVVIDLPVPLFFRELHVEWGDNAKFIFTYRQLGTWLNSQENHMGPSCEEVFEHKLMYGAYQFDRELWRSAYSKFVFDVVSYNWLPGQLLMFSFEQGDGYEKLCNWLSLPVPQRVYSHE